MDFQLLGTILGAILIIFGLGSLAYGTFVAVTSTAKINGGKGAYLVAISILMLIEAGKLLNIFAQGV